MKKLRLKALSLGATEILTREQLKAITGGSCTSVQDCGALLPACVNGECVALGGGSGSGGGSDGGGTVCEPGFYNCCCNGECHSMLDCDVICDAQGPGGCSTNQ
jgi:hypothetical protein